MIPRFMFLFATGFICIVYWIVLFIFQFLSVEHPILLDFGIVKLKNLDPDSIAMQVIPELLIFPLGIFSFVFLTILWRMQVQHDKDVDSFLEKKKNESNMNTSSAVTTTETPVSSLQQQPTFTQVEFVDTLQRKNSKASLSSFASNNDNPNNVLESTSIASTTFLSHGHSSEEEQHPNLLAATSLNEALVKQKRKSNRRNSVAVSKRLTLPVNTIVPNVNIGDMGTVGSSSFLDATQTARKRKSRAIKRHSLEKAISALQVDANSMIHETTTTTPTSAAALLASPRQVNSGTSSVEMDTVASATTPSHYNAADFSSIEPEMLERLAKPHMSKWKILFITLILLGVSTVYPCLLAVPFLLFAILYSIIIALKIRVSSKFYFAMYLVIAFYAMLLVILYYIQRFHYMSFLTLDIYGQMVGFANLNSNWQAVVFALCCAAIYVSICSACNQYLMETYDALQPLKHFHKFVNFEVQFYSKKQAWIVKYWHKLRNQLWKLLLRVLETLSSTKVLQFGSTVLLLLDLLVVTISIPNVLSLVWLFFLFVGLVIRYSHFQKLLPLLMIYSILYCTSVYMFNIPNVFALIMEGTDVEVKQLIIRIGWNDYGQDSSWILFLQSFLLFFIALAFRLQRNQQQISSKKKKISQRTSETINLLPNMVDPSSYQQQQLHEEEEEEDVDTWTVHSTSTNHSMVHPHSKAKKKKNQFEYYVVLLESSILYGIKVILHLVAYNSYYVSLAMVYFAALMSGYADLIHGIYLMIFLLFFIFPWIAKKMWILLILYTQMVIFTLYLYNVYFVNDIVSTTVNSNATTFNLTRLFRLMGIIEFSKQEFWANFSWHLLILVSSSIQYYILSLQSVASITLQPDFFEKNVFTKLPVPLQGLLHHAKTSIETLVFLTFLVCLICFVVLKTQANVMDLIFLQIVFLSLILLTISRTVGWKLLSLFWYVVVLYCGLSLLLLYCYQFEGVAKWIQYEMSQLTWLQQIGMDQPSTFGLQVLRNKAVDLLPFTFLLLCATIQLKQFQMENAVHLCSIFKSSKKDESDPNTTYTIFSGKIKTYLDEVQFVFKRACILHVPKLMLIVMFVAARWNPTMIGLGYLLLCCVCIPFPILASHVGPLLIFYSPLVISLTYIYQFPFFAQKLQCPSVSDEDVLNVCSWINWMGFELLPNDGNSLLVQIVWEHLMIVLVVQLQQQCNIWKEQLKKIEQYEPGVIFLDSQPDVLVRYILDYIMELFYDREAKRLNNSFVTKDTTERVKLYHFHLRVLQHIVNSVLQIWDYFKFCCNHAFETFGFEISLIALLIGSLISIQTIWGLVYLLLFGICFFAGRRINRVYFLIVLCMELNLFILFVFNLKHVFPVFDLVKWITSFQDAAFLWQYITLSPDKQSSKVQDVIPMLYMILFFVALQARSFYQLNKKEKPQQQTNSSAVIPTSKLLQKYQQEQHKLHVELPVPLNHLDYTQASKPRNYWHDAKYLLYSVFPQLVLILLFIRGTINPSMLKLLGMVIALLYMNIGEMLTWKANNLWILIGIYLYCYLLVLAVYQIPIAMTLFNPLLGQYWFEILLRFINILGFRNMYEDNTLWLDVVLLCLYYVQHKLFDSQDYIFYTNYKYQQEKTRHESWKKNNAFRAAKILIKFVEQFQIQKKQQRNMEALTNYKHHTTSSSNTNQSQTTTANPTSNTTTTTSVQLNSTTALNMSFYSRGEATEMREGIQFATMYKQVTQYLLQNVTNSAEREAWRDEFKKGLQTLELSSEVFSKLSDQLIDQLLATSVEQIKVTKLFNQLYDSSHTDINLISSPSAEDYQDLDKQKEEGDDKKEGTKEQVKDEFDAFIENSQQEQQLEQTTVILEQQAEQQEQEEQANTQFTPAAEKIVSPKQIMDWNRIYDWLEWSSKQCSSLLDLVITFLEGFINIAYDKNEAGLERILNSEFEDTSKSKFERQIALFRLKLWQLLAVVKYFYLSHTDALCYFVFAVNLLVFPTVFNALFTISALVFAAIQYPVPHKFYWIAVLYYCQLLIGLQYVLFLLQDALNVNSLLQNMYSALLFVGWKPEQDLIWNIISYPIVLIVVFHHRNILKQRGDWLYYKKPVIGTKHNILHEEKKGVLDDITPEKIDQDKVLVEEGDEEDEEASFIESTEESEEQVSEEEEEDLNEASALLHSKQSQTYDTNLNNRSNIPNSARAHFHVRQTAQSYAIAMPQQVIAEEPQTAKADDEQEDPLNQDLFGKFTQEADEEEDEESSPDSQQDENQGIIQGVIQTIIPDPVAIEDSTGQEKRISPFAIPFLAIKTYFEKILDSSVKIGSDFYVAMVSIEVIFLVFFFLSFQYISGKPTNDITGALRTNDLPLQFVVAIIVFFMLIVADRIIYIYASLGFKLVFQILQVFAYHILYFLMYDYIYSSYNSQNIMYLQVLFMLKYIYLWISCLQIRNGYPKSGTLSSFFTRSTHYITYYIYMVWRAIPFVFELKTLLDWTFIKTTLTFYLYLKVEDCKWTLYTRKSYLDYLKAYPRSPGTKQPFLIKASSGFLLFVFICMILFFPLVFFSTGNPVLQYNNVVSVETKIGIPGFEPFYSNQIQLEEDTSTRAYTDFFGTNGDARYLADFDSEFPIQNVTITKWSETYWTIPTPSRLVLLEDLEQHLNISITYTVYRKYDKQIANTQAIPLSDLQREQLRRMLNGTATSYDLVLPFAYNPFVVNKATDVKPSQFLEGITSQMLFEFYTNCTLSFKKNDMHIPLSFWSFSCIQRNMNVPLELQKKIETGPFFFIQSRKSSNSQIGILQTISSFGILSFYSTLVLAIGRLIRTYTSGLVGRIYYEDLEDVDLLYAFCLDIYNARTYGDLKLEELLTRQLISIFRNTGLLTYWTKK